MTDLERISLHAWDQAKPLPWPDKLKLSGISLLSTSPVSSHTPSHLVLFTAANQPVCNFPHLGVSVFLVFEFDAPTDCHALLTTSSSPSQVESQWGISVRHLPALSLPHAPDAQTGLDSLSYVSLDTLFLPISICSFHQYLLIAYYVPNMALTKQWLQQKKILPLEY